MKMDAGNVTNYNTPYFYDELEQSNPLKVVNGTGVCIIVDITVTEGITLNGNEFTFKNGGGATRYFLIQRNNDGNPSNAASRTVALSRNATTRLYLVSYERNVVSFGSSTEALHVYFRGAKVVSTPYIDYQKV